MGKVITVIVAIVLIGFILWWFFDKHEQVEVKAKKTGGNEQEVKITVDGGYSPETVVLQKGVPATLVFERKDPSSCLERVVFSDFGINELLPQNEEKKIKFDTSKAGEFGYACGMNMFHGKVVVK
ncbi:cupredoxin domain-containing protein [Ligilactobacillus faecis]|uniref:cupredoxin domain-containing protein n=1 Tax=Ligilactobacillus faecis TaxID=762833 RepID=UPI002469776D|nr:cupredoxin domain-containing protein [Ligilactobacillus faecis]WGN90448.1 cupredoxin domain-containing protein [Ligilactobacillus faecis]